jgi:hypothetical protein
LKDQSLILQQTQAERDDYETKMNDTVYFSIFFFFFFLFEIKKILKFRSIQDSEEDITQQYDNLQSQIEELKKNKSLLQKTMLERINATKDVITKEKEQREATERELIDVKSDRNRLKALLEAEHHKFLQLQQRYDDMLKLSISEE